VALVVADRRGAVVPEADVVTRLVRRGLGEVLRTGADALREHESRLVVVVLRGPVVDTDVRDTTTTTARLVPGVRVDQHPRAVLLVSITGPVDRLLRRLLRGDVHIEGGVVLRNPRPHLMYDVLLGSTEVRRIAVGVVRRHVDRVDTLGRVPGRTGDGVAVEVQIDHAVRAGLAVQFEGRTGGVGNGLGGPAR
jgi:hypothetical protein